MPFVRPENKVLVCGNPIVEELQTEGTAVKPRLLVVKGTGDHQVSLAGVNVRDVLGVVDYDPRYKITDAFVNNHSVRVLSGSIVVVLTLAESQTINKGDKLRSAANGQVQALQADQSVNEGGTSSYTIYYARTIGIARESVTTGAGETKPIMVELVI